MARRADHVTLRADAGEPPEDPSHRAQALARHVVGQTVRRGDRIALPGWPDVVVDETEPAGEVEITPDTHVEVWWPVQARSGPADVVFVVDGSLTMGRGRTGATPIDRAAWAIQAIVLNATSAIGAAGIVVHGANPRLTQPFVPPDELNAHVIHRASLRGRFDHARAVRSAVGLLATRSSRAPKHVVIVTDGRSFPADTAPLESTAGRHNVSLSVLLTAPEADVLDDGPAGHLAAACNGVATNEPKGIVDHIAAAAGAHVTFHPIPPPVPIEEGQDAFEVVIETLDEERP